MANKAISELPQAQNVNNQDLFVLEQSGIAKKLPAETFITEQGIIDALAEALDGHGGIQSVTLSSVSGRIRTYRITFTDQSATTFQVYDGTSIDRISRTSSSGLDDVYTIFLSDGTTTFFTVHNGADGTVSEAMLNDALKDKAPAITETTESGAIANFTDGADDLVMHNIVAEIAPVQSGSGDPSPDNIRPISGWTGCNVTRTGVNIWDEEWENGYIDASGVLYAYVNAIRSKNYCACKPNTTYYFKRPSGMTGHGVAWYTADKQFINRIANTFIVTAPNDAYFFKMSLYNYKSDGKTEYLHDISLNYPSTDTSYHSGHVLSLPISWQTEAGTVYGGTIDVATGLLTVDRAIVDLGTLAWAYNSGNNRFDGPTISSSKRWPNPLVTPNAVCECLKTVSFNNLYQGADNAIAFDTRELRARCTTFGTNADAFKTAVTGQSLVYELATPQTYQLTGQQLKTLYGTNNVWADTGNVTVKYPADTKMFIEKLTIPTEDDMVANQAITSGQYFMVGNSLYLALANIASGAQITIGTNAQRVSLADALNTINS